MDTVPGATGRSPGDAPSPRLRPEILAALKDSASVGLGLAPMGLAFGVFVTHTGLPWWSAPMFSAALYTGAFEFLLVPLVVAATPLAAIGGTALLVNGRHAFYALSFPLHRVRGRVAKTYSTFALSDEAYAMTTGHQARTWSSARIVALQAFMHLYCIGGSTLGALIGSLLPASITGLEFAMTALLTVLALDAVTDRREDVLTPVSALLAVLIARLVFPAQMLLAAVALFAVALLARYLLLVRGRSDHA